MQLLLRARAITHFIISLIEMMLEEKMTRMVGRIRKKIESERNGERMIHTEQVCGINNALIFG